MECISFKNFLQSQVGITDGQFEKILPYLQLEKVAKGHIIKNIKEEEGNLFFVDKGLLRFYSVDMMGKERILQFAPENWFIGDRANLVESKSDKIALYNYQIDAIEDSVVVRLASDYGSRIAKIEPEFIPINERLLQKHILHLQHRINLLIGSSVRERYEDFIRMYPDLLQRVPQWMIASYLGVTPEGLSRVRNFIAKEK